MLRIGGVVLQLDDEGRVLSRRRERQRQRAGRQVRATLSSSCTAAIDRALLRTWPKSAALPSLPAVCRAAARS